MMQSDELSMEEAEEGSSGQKTQATTLPSKIPGSDVQLLSNLRGSDHAEQHFSLSRAISEAFSSRTTSSLAILFKGSLPTDNISSTRILAMGLMLIITVVSLVIVCSSPDDEPCRPVDQDVSPSRPGPAKPREELEAMRYSDGTWACTFQQADEQSKQGLELLFRCHIIPTAEFAESKVSQEHIGECIWIAMYMLREKPLEEWLENWPDAQRFFEECVTACFATRTNVRSSFYYALRDQAAASPTSDAHTSLGHSSAGVQNPMNKSPPGARPVLPHVLRTHADRTKLTDRCRQIMAASDARKKSWAAKSPGSASSSSPGGAA